MRPNDGPTSGGGQPDPGSAVVPIVVSGPESVVELPRLPRVPDGITFNPFEAVLAETHTEDWND